MFLLIKNVNRIFLSVKGQIKSMIKKMGNFSLSYLIKLNSLDNTFPIYLPQFTKRELYLWYIKVVKPLCKWDIQYRNNFYSKVPLDIIIPTINKDLDVLERVIMAAKENIKHPIGQIFIISNENDMLKNIIAKHSCVFVDERSILPVTKESISYFINGIDRSGWLFQQLLKLSGDEISTQEQFLVLDSDTVFVRPKIFIYRGKYIFDHSEEYNIPYYNVYSKIMKMEIRSKLSFVTHYMLFSRKYLQEMKKYMEIKNNQSWIDAILSNTDYNNLSGFSEYETYGNYMLTFHKNKMKREFWHNISFNYDNTFIPNFYKSVSMHSYNKSN